MKVAGFNSLFFQNLLPAKPVTTGAAAKGIKFWPILDQIALNTVKPIELAQHLIASHTTIIFTKNSKI